MTDAMDVRASRQCAALLACADGQIDAADLAEGPTTQDRVAVAAHPKAVFGAEGEMFDVERLCERRGLIVEARARHVFRDFLKQGHVGGEGREHLDDSLEPVAAICSADPLVNVPADDAKLHERARFSAQCPLTLASFAWKFRT